jgi:hypothetical protein
MPLALALAQAAGNTVNSRHGSTVIQREHQREHNHRGGIALQSFPGTQQSPPARRIVDT